MTTRELYEKVRSEQRNRFSLRTRLTLLVTVEMLVSVLLAFGLDVLLKNAFHLQTEIPLAVDLIFVCLLVGILVTSQLSKFFFDPIKKLRKAMRRNYYPLFREWPYRDVKPRIIAEVYMEDSQTRDLRDYKFFCFNGVVRCYKVDFDRFIEHHANYYDPDGNILDFGEVVCPPQFDREILLPENIRTMIQYAETLAKGQTFVRVDFYDVDGRIYFGEITFFPAAGLGRITPPEWDAKLGAMMQLPDHKIM